MTKNIAWVPVLSRMVPPQSVIFIACDMRRSMFRVDRCALPGGCDCDCTVTVLCCDCPILPCSVPRVDRCAIGGWAGGCRNWGPLQAQGILFMDSDAYISSTVDVYNDFDIILAYIASLAFRQRCRRCPVSVVYTTLLITSC